jgi:hypothetical protein
MCKSCDRQTLVNPLDPFGLEVQDGASSTPLLVGRDIYDFTEKVKKFYYEKTVWEEYSANSASHIKKWFGRDRAARQLDDCLKFLDEK